MTKMINFHELIDLLSLERVRHQPVRCPGVWVLHTIVVLLFLMLLSAAPCRAQGIYWTDNDIGSPTPATVWSSGTPTTLTAGGTGVGASSDSLSFVNTPVSGNTEITGDLSSLVPQSGTSPNAYAAGGLMVRDNTNASGAMAFIYASSDNGINFVARTSDGGTSTTIPGPSIQAPIYLRLAVSGTSIAGYQSSDGTNWQLVGKATVSLPSIYFVGLAVSSTNTAQTYTGTFNSVHVFTNVPQRSADMQLWLRADAGAVTSGTTLSSLADQSGFGNNATATSVTFNSSDSGISGLPSMTFNGTSSVLTLPTATMGLNNGASVYIITRPTTLATDKGLIRLWSDASDEFTVIEYGSDPRLYVVNGGTASSLIGTTALSTSTYQDLEVTQDTSGNANIYLNGATAGSGTVTTYGKATTSTNIIGANGTYYFSGNIAEVLVFNQALSSSQRQATESYLASKFGLNAPIATAPTISVASGIYTSSQSVSITAAPGTVAFYTTDGSVPSPGQGTTQMYTGSPINVSTTEAIQVVGYEPGMSNSPVVLSKVIIDASSVAVTQSGLQLWLRADNGVDSGLPNNGDAVSSWLDLSGNNMTATGASGTRPTWTQSGFNGQPTINFAGSSSQFFTLPTGFANYNGMTVFMVYRPTTMAADQNFFDFGNGGASDDIRFEESDATGGLYWLIYSGTTLSTMTSSDVLSSSTAGVIEAVQDGSGNGYLYYNGNQVGSHSLYSPRSVSRTRNFIGRVYSGGPYLNGQLAEIIVYNSALSASQRQAIRSYLEARYGVSVNAPSMSPSSGVYGIAQTVTMSADPGASIYYTLDGTDPQTSGTRHLYSQPFSLTMSAVVTAKASQNFQAGTTWSAGTINNIVIDATAGSVPTSALYAWYRSDFGVTTDASNPPNVISWLDISNNGHTAGTSTTEPTLLSNAVNGLPAVNFGPGAYLNIAGTAANFTQGFSAFIVMKGVCASGGHYLNFVDNTNSYWNQINPTSGCGWDVYIHPASGGTVLSGGLISNAYQLLEATTGGGIGAIYQNGYQITSPGFPSVNQSDSSLPGSLGGGSTLAWPMSECLIYSRALSTAERTAIELYLMSRYGFGHNIVAAPTFSIPSGTLLKGPSQVAIAAPTGSTVYVTQDGSTPTTSSPVYSGPITVTQNGTIKAMASINGLTSAVTSASYTLPSTYPTLNAGDTNAPQINIQVPTPAQ